MGDVLTDSSNRRMRKLRVSLTDACNFRCQYCMPEDARFMPAQRLMAADEIVAACRSLIELGIAEIRITGGEPLLRREFREITQGISDAGPQKLGLTTNGYYLADHLKFLREHTSCHHINISIDSLRAGRFDRICRRPAFAKVLGAIEQARELELPLKLNVIAMRGVNDDEIVDFVKFSETTGIPVRFLELMRIGKAIGLSHANFIAAHEIIAEARKYTTLDPVSSEHDSTSVNFSTPKGGRIGLIASESMPFCGSCSRLRLSADGILRACLMSENGVVLRGRPASDYPDLLRQLLPMKPRHRLTEIEQNMNQIGG